MKNWLTLRSPTCPPATKRRRQPLRARAADILRPAGALARFDEVAAWVARWQETDHPAVRRPSALVFAADHGVTAAGVSKYPTDVTAAMLAAYRAGRSTVSAFAAVAGATVQAIDVGVGRPTGDIRFEAAMDQDRFDEAVAAGRDAVDALDADLLVLGEMGIGNTTAAAAVAAALGGGEVAAWVGRGTGVDDAGLARKREAVRQSVDRVAGVLDPLEVLREVGGAELVAMAAAIVAARHRRLPVLIDGYVVTAAALPLQVLNAARARPLPRRPLLVGARSPPPARTTRQAAVARPGDAPRRGLRGDGRGTARGHGVRRGDRRAHVQ